MLLTAIYLILIISICFVFFIPKDKRFLLQVTGLTISGFSFFLSCLLLLNFDFNQHYFQYINVYTLNFDFFNLYISVGLDGISIFFLY